MAPAKASSRRTNKQPGTARQRQPRAKQNGKAKEAQQQQMQLVLDDPQPEQTAPVDSGHQPVFIDPLFGTPLAIYVEKDVDNREIVAETISAYGGTVSQGYSGVTYVLVDPYKESGQNLYRQYASKKNKIVLNAQWVFKCVAAGTLQGFNVNWADCKVTGKEVVGNPPTGERADAHAAANSASTHHPDAAGAAAAQPPMAGPSGLPPVRDDVSRGAVMPPPMPHQGYYPPGVHPGMDGAPVYRPPPVVAPGSHHDYSTLHHYPMAQNSAVHPVPSTTIHDPTAAQNVAPLPQQMYQPAVPQPPAETQPNTSPPQRTTRPRRGKRGEQAAAAAAAAAAAQGSMVVQTVNGHPMPVTASALDPLDPLARAYAQRQEEERRRQEEEHARQEEERRRHEEDDHARRQEEARRREQGQQPQPPYNYAGYQPMHGEHQAIPEAPPQSWHASNGIAPQQTHLGATPVYDYHLWPPAYRPPDGMMHPPPPPGVPAPSQAAPGQPPPPPPPPGQEYDYRYQRDPRTWEGAEYYPPQQQAYGGYYPPQQPPAPREPSVPEAGPSKAADMVDDDTDQPLGHATGAQPRGRKRQRTQNTQPAPPASSLVANRHNPPARSPTPPSRVIKSTYGGNLFTSDDILYLRKYIEYVQEQGLVLSLREICERIAIKAPHHTFYSWRRYCNKHQIRLGGYHMDIDEDFPGQHEDDGVEAEQVEAIVGEELSASPPTQATTSGVSPQMIVSAQRIARAEENRARSPTPPRALFRSTTGKGVAFTEEDVTFLVRFLEHRNRQHDGKVDMVVFWKEVAARAPHHSRASWMKFYRRHKHELEYADTDAPLPTKPEKKMRYSKADDVLLARFFADKREGTSDKIFQLFARTHSHHPWKGWQEHHRIHKAKIDHLITKLQNGESIDAEANDEFWTSIHFLFYISPSLLLAYQINFVVASPGVLMRSPGAVRYYHRPVCVYIDTLKVNRMAVITVLGHQSGGGAESLWPPRLAPIYIAVRSPASAIIQDLQQLLLHPPNESSLEHSPSSLGVANPVPLPSHGQIVTTFTTFTIISRVAPPLFSMADQNSSSSITPSLVKPFQGSSKPIPLSPSKRNGLASSTTKISRTWAPFKHASPERRRGQHFHADNDNIPIAKKLSSVKSLIAKFETQAKSASVTTPTRAKASRAMATPTPTPTGTKSTPSTSSADLRIRLPHFRIAQSLKTCAVPSVQESEKENAPVVLSDSFEDESDVEDLFNESSDDSHLSIARSPSPPQTLRVWDARALEAVFSKALQWAMEQAPNFVLGSYVPGTDFIHLLRTGLRSEGFTFQDYAANLEPTFEDMEDDDEEDENNRRITGGRVTSKGTSEVVDDRSDTSTADSDHADTISPREVHAISRRSSPTPRTPTPASRGAATLPSPDLVDSATLVSAELEASPVAAMMLPSFAMFLDARTRTSVTKELSPPASQGEQHSSCAHPKRMPHLLELILSTRPDSTEVPPWLAEARRVANAFPVSQPRTPTPAETGGLMYPPYEYFTLDDYSNDAVDGLPGSDDTEESDEGSDEESVALSPIRQLTLLNRLKDEIFVASPKLAANNALGLWTPKVATAPSASGLTTSEAKKQIAAVAAEVAARSNPKRKRSCADDDDDDEDVHHSKYLRA